MVFGEYKYYFEIVNHVLRFKDYWWKNEKINKVK